MRLVADDGVRVGVGIGLRVRVRVRGFGFGCAWLRMMASKARGTKRRGKDGSTRSSSDVVPNLVWSQPQESVTSAGPHGRTAACRWAVSGAAACPGCAAQPGVARARPRRPGAKLWRLPGRRFSAGGPRQRAT